MVTDLGVQVLRGKHLVEWQVLREKYIALRSYGVGKERNRLKSVSFICQ